MIQVVDYLGDPGSTSVESLNSQSPNLHHSQELYSQWLHPAKSAPVFRS